MAASKKQVEELQRAHDQKIKEQKIIEEKRKLMESQQKQVLYNKELSRALLQKEHSNSNVRNRPCLSYPKPFIQENIG